MALSKRAPESLHVCFVMPAFEVYSPVRGLALAIITDEVTAELRARGVRTTVISPSAGDDLYQGGTGASPHHDWFHEATNVIIQTLFSLQSSCNMG